MKRGNKLETLLIGERLKELRNNKKLTQKEVASKINVEAETYSRYERDLLTPKLETIVELAVIFNSSLDYIVSLDKRSNIFIDDLPKDKQKLILTLVDTIRNEYEETKKIKTNPKT